MKNITVKLIVATILLTGGYFVWKELKKTSGRSKDDNVKIIFDAGKNADAEFIATFEKEFLDVWATAVLTNQPMFTFKGKKYNTQGGTSVK